jgi:hypothetical protein
MKRGAAGKPLCASAHSPARAALGHPASLSGSDGGFLSAIAGESRAQLEMRGVFQAVTPSETVLAHDAHHLAPSGRKASAPVSGRHAADVHGQPRLVHRSSGPLGAVYPAPGAATATAGAPIDGVLLGARAESAVNTRPDAPPAHVAYGGVEPRASVIVERIYATAPQRLQVHIRYKGDDDQADSDRQKGKRRLNFRAQHCSEELTLTVRGGGILPHIRPGRHPPLVLLALASLAFQLRQRGFGNFATMLTCAPTRSASSYFTANPRIIADSVEFSL